jgi:hypothetical protein
MIPAPGIRLPLNSAVFNLNTIPYGSGFTDLSDMNADLQMMIMSIDKYNL